MTQQHNLDAQSLRLFGQHRGMPRTRIALVRTVCKIRIKIKSLSHVSSPTLSLSLKDLVPFFCQGQNTCHCQSRRDVFHPNVDPGCVGCFSHFRAFTNQNLGPLFLTVLAVTTSLVQKKTMRFKFSFLWVSIKRLCFSSVRTLDVAEDRWEEEA